ncbi:small ubiquitin-related modifier [Streptomyces roseus]|uniref:Ubiquitin-like domain-containing protein n=1 Tax=Streptomyces roseus TaxID=66430 RepID=A0A0J6XIZ9_9ACTN|nr:small ubiquitin-related modifier [Streptomyces roseus]KMO94628.1 hypothetical protein ACS04_29030 [Streptomyces roseus]
MTDEAMVAEDGSDGATHIQVKVRSVDGHEVNFRIRRTTRMEKVMTVYCARIGHPVADVRFLYDGERISWDSTPEDLGMQDDDLIDVMVQQVGA